MIKRMIAGLLSLALLISALPAMQQSVCAEGITIPTKDSAHDHTDHGGSEDWQPWTNSNALPDKNTAGCYYLETNVQINSTWEARADIKICLNGHSITQKASGQRIYDVYKTLTIFDCKGTGKITGGTRNYGAAFSVKSGAVLNLYGGKITGNSQTADGGAIYIPAGGTVNMFGGEISGNTGKTGAGVCLAKSNTGATPAAFYLYGGEITNNTATGNGGAVYGYENSRIYIANGTLKGNTAVSGGAIYAATGVVVKTDKAKILNNTAVNGGGLYLAGTASLEMLDGQLSGNTVTTAKSAAAGTTSGAGGALYAQDSVQIKIDGTLIKENQALKNGENTNKSDYFAVGGVAYLCNNVQITLENTQIQNNSAQYTGGVFFLRNNITFEATDTTIKNNTTGWAGNIYMLGTSCVTLKNTTLTGNASTAQNNYAGGIFVTSAGCKLIVSGKTVVQGNTNPGNTANRNIQFNHADSDILYVDGLTEGANVDFGAGKYTGTQADDIVKTLDGEAPAEWSSHWVTANGQSVGWVEGKGFEMGHFHGEQLYTPWTSGTSLPNNGYHFLTQDVVRSAIANLTGDVHICLCGHNITTDPNATEQLRLMNVQSKVTIEDCTAHTDSEGNYVAGKLTGGNRTYGAAVSVAAGGVFTLEEGMITGNSNSDEAGAVYIAKGKDGKPGGIFVMNGGMITGNSSKRGGAVAITTADTPQLAGSFIMNGGIITGNTATAGDGGAILTYKNSKLQLLGGTITGNTATGNGGGVYIHENIGSLMLGGDLQITENLVAQKANDLYLAGKAVMQLQALETEAKIGLNAQTGNRSITPVLSEDVRSRFTYNGDDYKLLFRDNTLFLAPTHEHCVEGESGCAHTQLGWSTWTDSSKLPTSGCYCLAVDVKLTATMVTTGDLMLCLNGHSITVDKENIRVADISTGTELTITDCAAVPGAITGGNRDYGAAFSVKKDAVLNLYNAKLCKNTNTTDAGAVYVAGGATFNMYSGELSENSARTGAAVCIAKTESGERPGVFNLYGGTIRQNTATGNGGAVFGYKNAQIHLLGGTITENTAGNGGGVYMQTELGQLTLGGQIVIAGNKNSQGSHNNLYMEGAACVQLQNLQAGAKIGVSNNGTLRAFTGAAIQEQEAYFTSDQQLRTVRFQEGALWLVASDEHTHCLCGAALSGCDHTAGVWAAWEAQDRLPTQTGAYYLTGDVTLQAAAAVYGDVKLCLNGYTVRIAQQEGKEARRIADIYEGATLTITDCAQAPGKLTGGTRDYGGAFSVKTGATLCLYGGIITDNHQNADGGAIYLAAGATLYMYGGTLTGNSASAGGAIAAAQNKEGVQVAQIHLIGGRIDHNEATRGGGVFGYEGAQLKLSGTELCDNTATKYGGAIYLRADTTMEMTAGQLSGNQAQELGGALYLTKSRVQLKGGMISNNTSQGNGGAIYSSTTELTIGGDVQIRNNKAVKGAGGGICVAASLSGKENIPSKLTITGGIIADNQAQNSGGGLYIQRSEATFTGGTIHGNRANGNGGGIYLAGSTATLENVQITNNTAAKDAGAVGAGKNSVTVDGEVCDWQSKIIIKKGTNLKGNTAANGGAVLTYHYTVLNIQGGSISNNTALKNGGGVFINTDGTVKMSGGSISGNRSGSTNSGGGLYVTSAKAVLTGGSITGNWCGKYGGGVYGYKAQVDMSGSYISGNYADESGGGMSFSKESVLTMTGGTVTANTVKAHAAGVLIQSSSKLNLQGGTISENKAPGTGGGVYISSKCRLTMTDGKLLNNTAEKSGGGLYANSSEVTITGGEFRGNYGGVSGGGGVYFTRCQADISNVTIAENLADNSGGGLIYSRSTGTAENILIENNRATVGAGMLVQMYSKVTAKNLTITDNQALEHSGGGLYIYSNTEMTMTDSRIAGNTAKEDGGGVYMHTGQSLNDKRSYLVADNLVVEDNTSGRNGGGLYIDFQMHLQMMGGKVQNNDAALSGGGIYASIGSAVSLEGNTLVTGNTCTQTGSALYGGYDVNLLGCEITGNTTQEGAAVYLTPGNYDGHSYTNGKVKFAGDLIIRDNQGTLQDLYIDQGKTVGTTQEDLGENTYIRLQLHSGVLTQTIFATYNYEGGENGVYTLTYGDRSIREPEYVQPQADPTDPEQEQPEQPQQTTQDNTALYIGIGGIVVLLAAAAVAVILLKKKKAGKAESK